MYSLNQVKTLVLCGRDPARSLPLWRGFLLIPLILVCFAFAPQTRAQGGGSCLDGCDTNFGTFQGQDALLFNGAVGAGNSAFGWRSLYFNTGSFNTGFGGGTLALNLADSNTAVGAAAMILNIGSSGKGGTNTRNTACGTDALVFNGFGTSGADFNGAFGAFSLFNNSTGFSNNAVGDSALFANLSGAANTAMGDLAMENNDSDGAGIANFNTGLGAQALFANVDGDSNNAVGFNAIGGNTTGLFNQAMGVNALSGLTDGASNIAIGDSAQVNSTNGDFNTVVGDMAGQNIIAGSDNIYIGAGSGGDSDESFTARIGELGFVFSCYIQGIAGNTESTPVCIDTSTGQLGECAGGGSPGAMKALKDQAAKIASQEQQIQTLTAALKQQAEQIQKVSAQLEMVRPAPRVVNNH